MNFKCTIKKENQENGKKEGRKRTEVEPKLCILFLRQKKKEARTKEKKSTSKSKICNLSWIEKKNKFLSNKQKRKKLKFLINSYLHYICKILYKLYSINFHIIIYLC